MTSGRDGGHRSLAELVAGNETKEGGHALRRVQAPTLLIVEGDDVL